MCIRDRDYRERQKGGGGLFLSSEDNPVSYTHLDVYKRQNYLLII